MLFSLDKPGFLASADMSQEASCDSPPPPSAGSSSSASAPLSGDSLACRNCPKCRRRMSKPVFDCHTVCFHYRGFDCDTDNCCDECLEWSQEEMEAYVKHCKLILRKDKRRKDCLPNPPSSLGPSPSPSQPPSVTVTDAHNCSGSQLAELSASFDQNLESLTSVLLTKISLLQPTIEHSTSARMFNVPSTAPHPGWMHLSKTQKVLSDSTESFWGMGMAGCRLVPGFPFH